MKKANGGVMKKLLALLMLVFLCGCDSMITEEDMLDMRDVAKGLRNDIQTAAIAVVEIRDTLKEIRDEIKKQGYVRSSGDCAVGDAVVRTA